MKFIILVNYHSLITIKAFEVCVKASRQRLNNESCIKHETEFIERRLTRRRQPFCAHRELQVLSGIILSARKEKISRLWFIF